MKKVKRTHGKIVYRSKELKDYFELDWREKFQEYLCEWEDGLLEEMQADETVINSSIFESSPEFASLRHHEEVIANQCQESFTTFKSFVPTRWYSSLKMLKSYEKNQGKHIHYG